MAFPTPEALPAPLASRLPPHPAWLLPPMAGAGLLVSAGQGHVSLVTWLAAAGLLLTAFFPDRFSFLAYAIGVMAFVAAEQGIAQDFFKQSGLP
jgi:hypothetical protein